MVPCAFHIFPLVHDPPVLLPVAVQGRGLGRGVRAPHEEPSQQQPRSRGPARCCHPGSEQRCADGSALPCRQNPRGRWVKPNRREARGGYANGKEIGSQAYLVHGIPKQRAGDQEFEWNQIGRIVIEAQHGDAAGLQVSHP